MKFKIEMVMGFRAKCDGHFASNGKVFLGLYHLGFVFLIFVFVFLSLLFSGFFVLEVGDEGAYHRLRRVYTPIVF